MAPDKTGVNRGNLPDGDREDAGNSKMAKDHQKAAAALDAITDHVDEQDFDSSALKHSMQAMLGSSPTVAKSESATRDRELAKVKIQQADIDRIVEELEIDTGVAERVLREAEGDLVRALLALVM